MKRPRISLLLMLVLMIPLGSLAAFTGSSAVDRWSDRRSAVEINGKARALGLLMRARALVINEYVPSSALADGANLGLNPAKLTAITGADYISMLREARPLVDQSVALHGYPLLAGDLRQLGELRPKIDAGHAAGAAVLTFFGKFTDDIDTTWKQLFAHIRRDVITSHGTGLLAERVELTANAFGLLMAAMQRGLEVNIVVKGASTPASVIPLVVANSTFAAYAAAFAGRLGPHADAAWQAWKRDPQALGWENVVAQTVNDALAGRRSPLATNLIAYGKAFSREPRWLNGLTAVIEGASTDVSDAARHNELSAVRSSEVAAAIFLLSLLLAAVAAILLTRAVVRPLRRLAASGRQVAAGNFTLPLIPPSGPREVADIILTVDDMTAVLAAVESFTVTLATDPTAPSLDIPLPGGTGLALQTTLDRLRLSVIETERQRVRMGEIATHDGLTGLLNRAAAVDGIGRELSRAQREDTAVMVAFVDLDGLKAVNDTYGHRNGDAAIRFTAQALRSATRDSDIVARLGGDEFLVSGGSISGSAEVQAFAERLHDAVNHCSLDVDGQIIPLRCSIGVAISEPVDNVDSLIHRADQALYTAKKQGGNQISSQYATTSGHVRPLGSLARRPDAPAPC